jgi:hypothetical protein
MTKTSKNAEMVANLDLLQLTLVVMSKHHLDARLIEAATGFLYTLSTNVLDWKKLVPITKTRSIVSHATKNVMKPMILTHIFGTLRNVVANDVECSKSIVNISDIVHMLNMMSKYLNTLHLQRNAISYLNYVIKSDARIPAVLRQSGMDTLLKSAQTHIEHKDIVLRTCTILSVLTTNCVTNAQILEAKGISILSQMILNHLGDSEVEFSVCHILHNLCQFSPTPDITIVMKDDKYEIQGFQSFMQPQDKKALKIFTDYLQSKRI